MLNCFLCRSFDDARDALDSRSRIILFDKPAMVEAVYESASREEYESRAASMSPPRYGDRAPRKADNANKNHSGS